jgi:hypothetical protein
VEVAHGFGSTFGNGGEGGHVGLILAGASGVLSEVPLAGLEGVKDGVGEDSIGHNLNFMV